MSKETKSIFFEMDCLRTERLSGATLKKQWFSKMDARYPAEVLQKFIDYNQQSLDFLQITPTLYKSGKNIEISFQSKCYIGAVPLKSPENGKPLGDFVVKPKFANNPNEYLDLLDLLNGDIQPDFYDSEPLLSGSQLDFPIYIEAIKYIEYLLELTKKNWRKFENVQRIYDTPRGNVNWNTYIQKGYDPIQKLRFPCRVNEMTENHKEYRHLKFVFKLAKEIINASSTPIRVRSYMQGTLGIVEQKLGSIRSEKTVTINMRHTDSHIVKNTKKQANILLNKTNELTMGWRLDFSMVFEKFVQKIFHQIAETIGADHYNNIHFIRTSANAPAWSLRYLEPDIVMKKGNISIIADAKYKSHLYLKFKQSDWLKEEHRKDLHQILAYTSFLNSKNKVAFLCYPADSSSIHEVNYMNDLQNIQNTVYIVGIEIDLSKIENIKALIRGKIVNLMKE